MGKFREPSVGRHYQDEPQIVGAGVRCWITRGRNFAIVYTEAKAGARIANGKAASGELAVAPAKPAVPVRKLFVPAPRVATVRVHEPELRARDLRPYARSGERDSD